MAPRIRGPLPRRFGGGGTWQVRRWVDIDATPEDGAPVSEWPEGWFRDGGAGQPPGPPGPVGAGDPTVQAPRPGLSRGSGAQGSASGYGPGGASGYGPGGRLGSGSAWPEQPPVRTPGHTPGRRGRG